MLADKRVITSTRHEYYMQQPVHWSEVDKAISVAVNERNKMADDAVALSVSDVFVSSEEENILIAWTEEQVQK